MSVLARPLPRLPHLHWPALPSPRPLIERIGTAWEAARFRVALARTLERSQRSVLDTLAPEWAEHTADAYVIEGVWTRSLGLREWPPRLLLGWPEALLAGCGGDITLAIHSERLPTNTAKSRLRAQRTVQTTVAQMRAEQGTLDDPTTTLAATSAAEVEHHMAAGHEQLFACSATLTLRAPNEIELDALEARVRGVLKTLGAGVYGTKWQHAAGFRTTLPYGNDSLGRTCSTLDTTSLAFSFPCLEQNVGTADGPLWGHTMGFRSPVLLDLWDADAGWPAPHVVIVGPTGGGKTVTAGHLVAQHLTQADPPDVVLIDPAKGDYRRLVRELGGQVVRLSTRTAATLNPFDLPPATVLSGTGETATQNPVMEQARLATGLIALMVCDEGQKLSRLESALVEGAILDAYRACKIDPDVPETWTLEPPILPLVLAKLQHAGNEEPAAKSLASRLRPFCTGTLAGLFSKHTTLDIGAGLTSFDLEGLDSELRPLAIWLIGNHVWKLAKADRRRRILCLDEVRTLLEYPESARLVAHLYTLGRAYRLSVWSMSQFVTDYTANAEGRRAIENAPTALVLSHKGAAGAAAAQDYYHLPEDDREFVERAGRGEGVLITPRGRAYLHVTPSPLLLEWMGGPTADSHQTSQDTTAAISPAPAGVVRRPAAARTGP